MQSLRSLLFLLLLAHCPPAAADEQDDKLEALASALAERFDQDRADELGSLLAQARRDPWLLAHVLVAQDRLDVAQACARSLPQPRWAAFRAYMGAERDWPQDELERILGARARLRSPDSAAVQERLKAPAPKRHPFLEALRHLYRARVFGIQKQAKNAAGAYLVAAVSAENLGWDYGALLAGAEGARLARSTGDYGANLTLTTLRQRVYASMGNAPLAAREQGHVASAHAQIGDYAGAVPLYERALSGLRRAGRMVDYARALRNYGLALKLQGNFAGALNALSEAVELGQKAPWLHDARSLIGSVQTELGDFEEAIVILESAVKGLRTAGDERRLALAISNLTLAYGLAGNVALAEETYADARARLSELKLQSFIGLLDSDRAIWLARRGRVDEALTAQRRAHAAAVEASDLQTELQALDHIAELLVDKRELTEARKTSAELIETLLAMGRSDGLVSAHERLARIDEAEGKPKPALTHCLSAIDHMERVLDGLDEVSAAFLRERRARPFETGLRVAHALEDTERFVAILERGRAALQDRGSADTADVRAQISTELQEQERQARIQAALAKTRLTDLRARDAPRRETRSAAKALKASEGELRSVLRRVQRESHAGAALYPPSDDLPTIQAALGKNETLVLYSLVGAQTYAVIVTRTAADVRVLGETAKLEAICDDLRFSDSSWDATEAVEELRTHVIDPLKLPKRSGRLLLSVDGVLAFVPFQTLLPHRELTYVPSGTAYRILRDRGVGTGVQVLAVGDPLYGDKHDEQHILPGGIVTERGEKVATRGGLQPLPASEAEAKAVGDVVLIEAEATEARLREVLSKRRAEQKRWKALHFACHGLADTERPIFSSLALTQSGEDDGYLHAHEVLAMGIDADLVVLSACDTARGRYFRAFGVRGLARSFLDAGASGVVVSLWKVPDEPTGVLMRKFHALWNPRDGKTEARSAAAALKAAQEHVQSIPKWKHPYFWAAWQLWGLAD